MARAKKSKTRSKTRTPARKAAGKGRQKPIEVYFWPTPNGYKITCALEEMGLPYMVKPVNIARGEQFKPEFLKIAPNNRMPAIVDPNGPGGKPISVFESGAILQYLGRKTGKFYPKDERKRVEVDEWLMWQMGGIGPMMGQANVFFRYFPEKIQPAIARYQGESKRLFRVLDSHLAEHEYLAGDYSIADIANFAWVRTWRWSGVAVDDLPHLQRWLAAIATRPAVVKGLTVPPPKLDITADNDDKAQQRAVEVRDMLEMGQSNRAS